MEPRYAGGKIELMPEQAAELERSGVDVIIAGPFEALQAAKQSTSPRSHHHDTQRRSRGDGSPSRTRIAPKETLLASQR
jgi:hypothetical protein